MQIVCMKDQNKLYQNAEKADNVGGAKSELFLCVAHKNGNSREGHHRNHLATLSFSFQSDKATALSLLCCIVDIVGFPQKV